MSGFSLNKKQIEEFQKNRDPYLFIDFVDNVIPGVSIEGYKDLNLEEWFFKAHWPSDPNMPGMLQIEALTQMSALSILTLPRNKGKIMYLVAADKLRFKKKVLPGSRLYIRSKVNKYVRGIANFSVQGTVDNNLVCSAEISLILPEEINKYKKK
jgi:3-hydroxyacyl-[acyl-carrier-protein] dehydratase